MNKLAQVVEMPLGGLSGLGFLGLESGDYSSAPDVFNRTLSTIIGVMTIIAGIWFVFLIMSGAISWMGAGGDKGAIEDAKKKIQNGLIGLAIVISAVFLVDIVGTILGFPYITNPAEFIRSVAPVPPTPTVTP
jgi:hypothetical protein